jgi:hypothetical protein
MSRRPKLSLVSNRELNKKQALNLDSRKPAGTLQSRGFQAKETASADKVSPHPHIREVRSAKVKRPRDTQTSSDWPDKRLVAKVVIVVATVALSIFLLKRRLM